MMFPLPALGHFDFDTRLLPVESINDAKYESSENSESDTANCERNGRAASDDKARNCNLVWRDSRFAKKRDDCGFDRRVDVSGQVQRSFLCGIKNDARRQTAILLQRRTKTEWPRVPTHADDVIIFPCRVDCIDLAVVDLPCEFTRKRLRGLKGQKHISRDQCRAAGMSNQ